MKRYFLIIIPLLLMAFSARNVHSMGVEFKSFELSDNYISDTPSESWNGEMVYLAARYLTKIQWPVAGMSSSELRLMRQNILRSFHNDSLYFALADRVDNPDFPTTIHRKIHGKVQNEIQPWNDAPRLHYKPATEVPQNIEILVEEGKEMELKRAKGDLFVFAFSSWHYEQGMTHPTEGRWMVNYDKSHNRPLALSDILDKNKLVEINRIYTNLVFNWQKENDTQDWEWKSSDGISLQDDSNWYINDEGIVFIFPPYYIAPGCYGWIEIAMPIKNYKHLFRTEALKYWGIGTKAGHYYVDLGLSVLWATTNIGAEKATASGEYYRWGDVNPYNQEQDTSDGWNAFEQMYNREEYSAEGHYSADKYSPAFPAKILPIEHDVAHVRWRDNWRMPTRFELEELYNKCTWKWIANPAGYVITGPNGNAIFLPAAGVIADDMLEYKNAEGVYPAATHDYFFYHGDIGSCQNDILFFNDSVIRHKGHGDYSSVWMNDAYTIRPVWSELTGEEAVKQSLIQYTDSLIWDQSDVSDPAQYVGGSEALEDYIEEHRNKKRTFPEDVYFRANFSIDKHGKVVKVIDVFRVGKRSKELDKSIEEQIKKEVEQLIINMPDWQPARHRGWAVPVYASLVVPYPLSDNPNYIFSTQQVKTPPTFPGGDKALEQYLEQQKITTPGYYFKPFTITAQCVVNADGTILLHQMAQNSQGDLDDNNIWKAIYDNMLEIIKKMPKWNPGIRDGKNVRTQIPLSIQYQSIPAHSDSDILITDLINYPLGDTTLSWTYSQRELFKALMKNNPYLQKSKHNLSGYLTSTCNYYGKISYLSITYNKKTIDCEYKLYCKSPNSAKMLAEAMEQDIRKVGIKNVTISYYSAIYSNLDKSLTDDHVVDITFSITR